VHHTCYLLQFGSGVISGTRVLFSKKGPSSSGVKVNKYQYNRVVSVLFCHVVHFVCPGSNPRDFETMKKFSTHQMNFSLPAAAIFERNALFLSV